MENGSRGKRDILVALLQNSVTLEERCGRIKSQLVKGRRNGNKERC